MEFNKIAGAVLFTLLLMMVIGKVGNTLVPQFHPPQDAPGHEAAPPPQTAEPEKPLPELLADLHRAGASAALFEVSSVTAALARLEESRSALESTGLFAGVMLAASENAVRGFGDAAVDAERWAERALDLVLAGARIIGGGAGTTEAHTSALARALGTLHPSLPAPQGDDALDRRRLHAAAAAPTAAPPPKSTRVAGSGVTWASPMSRRKPPEP